MITLTEREAQICERALEMVQQGTWPQFQTQVEEYTGSPVNDQELDTLAEKLRD